MARTLALERLTHARTVAARRVVWAALQGERVEAIAARFHVTAATRVSVAAPLQRSGSGGAGG